VKTSESIERQEGRKEAEKPIRTLTQNSGSVSGRRGDVENLKPGNPANLGRLIVTNQGKLAADRFRVPTIMESASSLSAASIS